MANVTTAARIISSGDAALVVEFGDTVDRSLSARVLALDAEVARAAIPGVVECVPSFRSLLVQFDPLRIDADQLQTRLQSLTTDLGASAPGPARHWRLPCCYEGDLAPDLANVAEATGLSPEDVITQHAGTEFHVYMLGFLPGAPYLGDLPKALTLPRLSQPRLRVPAGSVAMAMGLSVIYPVESPGGWRIIGRTPTPLFGLDADPPALLAPGDRIRFDPTPRSEYDRLAAAVSAGEWKPEPERAA